MIAAPPTGAALQRTLSRLRHAAIVLAACLAVLVATRILAEGSIARVLAAVVATAPLWLILPRLVRGERRAYAWTTLATVPYLVLGVTETVANPAARLWAMACVSVSFALFGLAVAYVRAAARAGRH